MPKNGTFFSHRRKACQWMRTMIDTVSSGWRSRAAPALADAQGRHPAGDGGVEYCTFGIVVIDAHQHTVGFFCQTEAVMTTRQKGETCRHLRQVRTEPDISGSPFPLASR